MRTLIIQSLEHKYILTEMIVTKQYVYIIHEITQIKKTLQLTTSKDTKP